MKKKASYLIYIKKVSFKKFCVIINKDYRKKLAHLVLIKKVAGKGARKY